MKKKTYQGLLVLSILSVLAFFYSCDLNSPVNVELIGVSVEDLDFGLFTDELVFTIENHDTITAAWDTRTWPGWISVDPSTGTLNPAGIDTFKVTVSRDSLSVGDYSGDIYIDFQGASENIYVQVNMQIKPVPVITPSQINLSSSDTRGSFSMDNRGNFPLVWRAVSAQGWLIVSPDSGTTDPSTIIQSLKQREEKEINQVVTISFQVNRNLLNAGVHVGLIEVLSNAGNDSVYVTVPQDEEPLLSVSTTQLNFDATTTSHTITIDNVGGGILDWQANSPDDWVTIDPDHGNISTQALFASLSKYNIITRTLSTNEMQVEISVRIAELDPGEIPSIVNITSNGGNETIDLTIDVPEQPVLDVSERVLNFGSTETSLTFDIINTGTGILDWQATASDGSLTITPTNGSTTTSVTVTVDLDRSLLQNTGDQTFRIDITSDGGNTSIDVEVNVLTPPQLSYTPGTIEFNENALSHPLFISNLGEEPLSWKLVPSAAWVMVSADSGITTTQTSEVIVSANTNVDLPSGTYNATIDITSNGGSGQVTVTATIPEDPTLTVVPEVLDFGNNLNSLSFDINNIGSGTLTWRIDKEGTFFGINPGEGETTTETDQITVIVTRDNLPSGIYTGYAIITSNGGVDTVEIKMTVDSNPILAVSDDIVDFGIGSNQERIYVKNEGNDRVIWDTAIEYLNTNIVSNVKSGTGGWLSLDPESGFTSDQTALDLYANRDLVYQYGESEAIVHITSNAGDIDILVTITSEGPVIEVLPLNLDFGSDIQMLDFGVKNIGGGQLDWNSSIEYLMPEIPPWLLIQPDYGNTTTKSDVEAFVDRTSLPTGIYEAVIHIFSNGGNADISVIMEVIAPSLGVSPLLLDFGETETEMTFDIKNIGSGTLNYSFSTNDYWISLSQYSGSVGAEKHVITVYVERGMPSSANSGYKTRSSSASEITGYIYVSNVDDQLDTEVIEVRMIQPDPPILYVPQTELDFATDQTNLFFEIQNIGEDILEWGVLIGGEFAQYVYIDAANGTTTTETDVVNVSVDRGLAPGIYGATISVPSNGGEANINVTWTIL